MKQNGSKKLRCARSVTSSAGFLRGGKTATHGTSGLAAVRRYITGSAMIPLKYYWMIYLQSDYKVLSFSLLSNDSVGGARILDHATIHPRGQGQVLPYLQPPLRIYPQGWMAQSKSLGSIHSRLRRQEIQPWVCWSLCLMPLCLICEGVNGWCFVICMLWHSTILSLTLPC
jgi:hypothetical protein